MVISGDAEKCLIKCIDTTNKNYKSETERIERKYVSMAVLSCSVESNSAIPWTAACQAPLSMGNIQARVLEWVAMPSSRGLSQPRDRTQVSLTACVFFTI